MLLQNRTGGKGHLLLPGRWSLEICATKKISIARSLLFCCAVQSSEPAPAVKFTRHLEQRKPQTDELEVGQDSCFVCLSIWVQTQRMPKEAHANSNTALLSTPNHVGSRGEFVALSSLSNPQSLPTLAIPRDMPAEAGGQCSFVHSSIFFVEVIRIAKGSVFAFGCLLSSNCSHLTVNYGRSEGAFTFSLTAE